MTTTSFAGQFKVATRIYSGFFFVLLTLIAVVVLGYRALTGLDNGFDDYSRLSTEAVGVLQVRAEIADIRRNAINFVNYGDPKSADAIRGSRDRLRVVFRDLTVLFRKPERRAAVEQMAQLAEEYVAQFEKVEAQRQRREDVVNKQIEPLGNLLRVNTTKILDRVGQNGDAQTAVLAGKAMETLMLGRIRVTRFLETSNDAVRAEAFKYFEEYRGTVAGLSERLSDSAGRTNVAEIQAKIGEYLAAFEQMAAIMAEMDRLTFKVMAPTGVKFAELADQLVDVTTKERSTIQDEFGASIAANISLNLTIAVVALVAGLLFAVAVARSIVKPVVDMTGAMTRLASGDLSVDVPATENRDEIGEMAKAVLVFKENAVQKRRMDEAEAARLAAERQQEEAERQRELAIGSEIAELIDAVSKGDLDRRINLAGKDGFYRTMSEGINRLTETVQAVIGDVGDVLSALASGDLTRRVNRDYQGAFARVKTDVNTTSERLAGIVGDITTAADTIATAAEEVSSGATDLAERTEQQASSLEETAASMEQLSGTVRSNAENAQRANRMAEDARVAAESGGGVAEAAIDAMKRIEEASRKITDIISVIDEIAFQTNLLALNAAVEAARAGDAGRGFAVVAQEVRQLAQRSAQASKEIKALILDSDGQVKEGVELVKKAGDALEGIVSGIQNVATLIAEMTSASSEQASALDEINIAIAQMDEMTQKNAALVEETTAAAHAMAEQSGDLKDQIAFFKLDGRAAAAAVQRKALSSGVSHRPAATAVTATRSAGVKPVVKATVRPLAKAGGFNKATGVKPAGVGSAKPAPVRTAPKPPPPRAGAAEPVAAPQGVLKHAASAHDDDDDWKEF